MVINSAGIGTKNDLASDNQQQLPEIKTTKRWSPKAPTAISY
jgi:hypothetical protein